MKNYLLQKVDELFYGLNRKYAKKTENAWLLKIWKLNLKK